MAEYPQKTSLKVQMRGIHFGSQVTHLEESTKTNHPLNRTLVTTCTNIYSEDIASENPKLVSGFPKTGQSPNFTFFDTAITTTLTKFTLIFSTITEYRWE